MTLPLNDYLILSGLLFSIGFFGVLLRKNVIIIFICIEIMLAACTLSLIALSKYFNLIEGMMLAFFITIIASVEIAIALALIMRFYQQKASINIDDLT